MELSEQQKEFIDLFNNALEQQILLDDKTKPLKLLLNGYAGTGKSFIVKYLIDNYPHIKFKVITFTNKAVNVLKDKGISGATSIHKFLYILEDDEEVDKKGNAKLKFKVAKSAPVKVGNKLIHLNPDDEKYDWIIVDEASMVDATIKKDLESLKKNLLMIGDEEQLPPVETDSKANNRSPVFTDDKYIRYDLTQVLRYDGEILKLSIDIREGRKIPYHTGSVTAKFQKLPNENILLGADVVIVGTNKTKVAVNNRIRKLKFGDIHDHHPPFENEKVVVNKSNPKHKLVNSDILTILDKDIDLSLNEFNVHMNPISVFNDYTETELMVKLVFTDYLSPEALDAYRGHIYKEYNRKKGNYDENPFVECSFSYALTAHKCQGSEFSKVLVVDQSFIFKGIEKNWLYTSLTRAKDKLIIVDRI